MVDKVDSYIRYKKTRSTHRMYCPVRKRRVVLGPNREDGDIAYLSPSGVPPLANESWERIDNEEHGAEVVEQEMQTKADAEDTLKIQETDEGFDVINTATGDAVNTAPLSKEDADAIVSGSPEEKKGIFAKIKGKLTGGGKDDVPSPPRDGEGDDITCPNEHTFGSDHDEHDECDECPLSESCKTASEVEE